MNRLEELTLRLLDDTIDTAEVRELALLMADLGCRARFLRLVELESYLLVVSRQSIANSVVADIQEERRCRIEDGVMSAVNVLPSPLRVSSGQNRGRMGWRFEATVGLALVAACVFFAIVWFQRSDRIDSPLAELIVHQSNVRLVSTDGSDKAIDPSETPLLLRDGEMIETSNSMDSAEIVYTDGTRIELLANTKVTLSSTQDDANQLTVVAGMIQADVAPQPASRPLRIVTSTATLQVLGTTLGVEVARNATQLEVASGLVAITRNVDDQRVDVSEGHFVRATNSINDAFEAMPFPTISSVWTEDLSKGLPAGWSGNTAATQSGLGIKTAANENRDGNYAITTRNAWQTGEHGLFQMHDDSVLCIRFRQTEFARITVMVATRVFPPEKGRFGANLFYTKKEWNENLDAGQPRTIRIPLREVGWHIRSRKKQGGAPDLNGLVSYLIHITTMEHDAGLTVDRMWVTRASQEQTQ